MSNVNNPYYDDPRPNCRYYIALLLMAIEAAKNDILTGRLYTLVTCKRRLIYKIA
jgi:hypothetical protein